MSLRTAAAITALGRAAFGVALIAAPAAVGSKWIGAAAQDDRAAVVVRAVGARDLVLGMCTARAISEDGDAAGWLAASAISDAVDFGAMLAARDKLPQSNVVGTLVAAGGSAALCVAAALAGD